MSDQDENYQETYEEPKKRSFALPFFIFLFLASLGLNLWLFFKYAKNGAEIQEQNKELALLYEAADFRADSLQTELDMVNQQLNDKLNELLAQEDLKESLREDLESQQSKLNSAYARISRLIADGATEGGDYAGGADGPRSLAEAKKAIADLETENKEKIEEVAKVQEEYKIAKETATEFQEKAKTYRLENDSLIEINEDIQSKLDKAGTLRIVGLNAITTREKRGTQEVTDKASKVSEVKISFSTQASEFTAKEEKDIAVRIISPTGEVLGDDNASSLKDIDEVVSIEESITYDGTEKPITFYFKQEAAYKKGRHTVEIRHNGQILDRKAFFLR